MTEMQIDWDAIETAKHAKENRWADLFVGEEPQPIRRPGGIGSPHPSTPLSQRQYDGRAAD